MTTLHQAAIKTHEHTPQIWHVLESGVLRHVAHSKFAAKRWINTVGDPDIDYLVKQVQGDR